MQAQRREFCTVCRLLYERHLVTGVGGNMALRIGDRILATPTGRSLRNLQPENLSLLNLHGELLEGEPPTKDLPLHLGALKVRPEMTVSCHIHAGALVAASALMEPGPSCLPPLTPGFVYYGYPLPLLPFLLPGSEDLAREAASCLASHGGRAVLLQNHGLLVMGKDLEEAFNAAEEIEEAARVYLLTQGKGKSIPSSLHHLIR